MGCIDAVIPEQLLRRPDVNRLESNGSGETYKDYLCLFRAIAVHLYGSSELEINAKNLFNAFLHESGQDAINFRGVSIDHLVFVENARKHNIFIYDIDIVDGDFVGELARRSIEMYEKILIYYVSTTTYAMWMILTHSFNDSVVPVAIRSFRKREISTVMLKRVKIEYRIFTQRVCRHCVRPYLISLTDLEFPMTMIKNCSRTWLFLTLNRYVYPPSN